MKYSQPKGTFDILPKQLKKEDNWKLSHRWRYVEDVIRKTCAEYGFGEIRTPIFESTDLFIRSVGDSSDIVSKEMYTFEDKGSRMMSLRPEGTAPVIRAFIENHLPQLGSEHKLFYIGPYFRYDRPQAGRFRQFHQFGVEAIGRSDAMQDVEIIDLLCQVYRRLGLKDLTLLINSVGDAPSRAEYQKALLEFLTPHFSSLSKESQERFHKNPLRILDTKDKQEIELLKQAPSILDYLTPHAKQHFEKVCDLLNTLKIPFTIEPRLVRGLDYYNHTVFEIISNVLGAQNTIGAGGRYDGLMKSLDGPDLPSIGFGTGIERILCTMEGQHIPFPDPAIPFLYLIPLGEKATTLLFPLLCQLRHEGVFTQMYSKAPKIQKAMQEASASGASYCLILGEEELGEGKCQLKDMTTRQSETIEIENLFSSLTRLWSQKLLEK